MTEPKETTSKLPIVDEIQSALKGEIKLDRVITEEEARRFLPQLLLAGEQQGISASELGSAIQISESGVLEIKNAEIQVDHPRFKGTVTLSAEIFNESFLTLAARNLDVKIEGGNRVSRAFIGRLIRKKLGKPHEAILDAFTKQVEKQSQGTRRLDKFGVQINGKDKSVRIVLSVTPIH